ncbi:MAG TPA: hypothetical protein VMR86_22085 [Myxococcota bacterium]|nr:hypothetical protein [Myxococcota bacterium]
MAAGRGGAFAGGIAVGLACAGAGAALLVLRPAPGPETPVADVQAVDTYTRPPEQAAAAVRELPPALAPAPKAEDSSQAPAPAAVRYAADYPVFEKLVSKPLSREPHQLLGAWDEDEHSSSPGERRAFVLAVSPGQSDASLEALARDVRERNLDARVLDVRIYDDSAAAIAPRQLDAGQNARAHLVAEVQRNPAAALDAIRVRGREIPP